jgi:hypothetical protein
MLTPPSSMPTLPQIKGAGERRALLAGVTFLEASSAGIMTFDELCEWFAEHVVIGGLMELPPIVNEPQAGSIPLGRHRASRPPPAQIVAQIVALARGRVVAALRGLLATPADDRFLAAALFSGRVRRRRGPHGSQWVAQIEPSTPLSGIVLSLFAVDILSNRNAYDRSACVCDTCGRLSFQDAPLTRRNCHEHPGHASGFTRAVGARKLAPSR